ncbi:MAG: hypothetical protein WCV00_17095 [Verrucomicrobiia bacterium]
MPILARSAGGVNASFRVFLGFIPCPRAAANEITLLNLATHTSALPRMPANSKSKDDHNPHSDG